MTRTVSFLVGRWAAFAFLVLACVCSAQTPPVAGHAKSTRVVLRFDARDDAKALDAACDVLRARLKELEATDVTVKRRPGRDVALEFRAPHDQRLDKDSEMIRALSQRGDMCFYIAAMEQDFTAKQKDMTVERQKVADWLKKPENARASIEAFNSLAEDKGGPPAGLRWYPTCKEAGK